MELSLFSGIGGFSLAARSVWENHHPLHFCEIDPFCRRVLSKHWPDVPIHGDIKTLDARPLRGSVDILTGGFPCQPYSLAGLRRGAEDDRALWPEMLRVIGESRPRWIVGENVAGIATMEVDRILSDLEGAGYTAEPIVLPAACVGAPHARHRLWFVANVDGERIEEAGDTGAGERSVSQSGNRTIAPDMEHSHSERCEEPDAPALAARAGLGDWGRAAGRGEWLPQPDMVRVVHGVSDRMDRDRIAALGNAIVPQVAAEIFRRIKEIDTTTDAAASDAA